MSNAGRMRRVVIAGALELALVLSLHSESALRAQTIDDKLHISALAVKMSNIGSVGANTVLMDINRWSTETERKR